MYGPRTCDRCDNRSDPKPFGRWTGYGSQTGKVRNATAVAGITVNGQPTILCDCCKDGQTGNPQAMKANPAINTYYRRWLAGQIDNGIKVHINIRSTDLDRSTCLPLRPLEALDANRAVRREIKANYTVLHQGQFRRVKS